MKINEFNNQQDDYRPNFDLVDDICIFMRNDPMFYRKSYFPMVNNMSEMFDPQGDVTMACFEVDVHPETPSDID